VKAVLLYDLAGLPAASASYAGRNGLDPRFREFFTRTGNSVWGVVARDEEALQLSLRPDTERPNGGPEGNIVLGLSIASAISRKRLAIGCKGREIAIAHGPFWGN